MVLKGELPLKAPEDFGTQFALLSGGTRGSHPTTFSFKFGRIARDHLEIIYGGIRSIESILQATHFTASGKMVDCPNAYVQNYFTARMCIFAQSSFPQICVLDDEVDTEITILDRHLAAC